MIHVNVFLKGLSKYLIVMPLIQTTHHTHTRPCYYTAVSMSDRWCTLLLIVCSFSPSSWFSLPIILLKDNLGFNCQKIFFSQNSQNSLKCFLTKSSQAFLFLSVSSGLNLVLHSWTHLSGVFWTWFDVVTESFLSLSYSMHSLRLF